MKTWAVVAGLVVGCATVAQADQLRLANVGADAKWVIHVDADAARATPVMQKFWASCVQGNRRIDAKLKKAEKDCGLNVAEGLHGITLYGTNFKPHEGVAIIEGKWNKDVLLKKLSKEADAKTVTFGDFEIHAWTAHKERKFAHEAAAAFAKPGQLVVAAGVAPLKDALNVLTNKAPTLKGKTSVLAGSIPPGTIFLARGEGMDEAKLPDKCALKLVKQIDLARGQAGTEWFGQLKLTATSDDVARQFKTALKGLLAMVSLHLHDQARMVKLLESVDFQVDGATLTATFKAPADEVAAQMSGVCGLVREHIDRHMKHRKAHGEHRAKKGEVKEKCSKRVKPAETK